MQNLSSSGFIMLILLGSACFSSEGRAQDLDRIHSDTRQISQYPSRMIGSSGHLKAKQFLLEQVQSLPNTKVWTTSFDVVAPQTREATLTLSNSPHSGVQTLYPLWPSGVRLNTTPESGLEGKLIYVGTGTPDRIPVKTLHGQIAVMEMSGSDHTWQRVAAMGASAIIFLGSHEETNRDSESHLIELPAKFPRYYIPEGPLADSMRQSEGLAGRISATAGWVPLKGENIMVLSPSTKQGVPALAILVPYDGISVVPDLSPGAHPAMNTALALELAREFSRNPPVRPILFCFVDAYGLCQRGVREFYMDYGTTARSLKDSNKVHQSILKEKNHLQEIASQMGPHLDLMKWYAGKEFQELHPMIKQEVSLIVLPLEERLQSLRLQLGRTGTSTPSEIQDEIDSLTTQINHLYKGQKSLIKNNGFTDPIQRLLWTRTYTRIQNQAAAALRYVQRVDQRIQNLRDLKILLKLDPDSVKVPILAVMGIDLSDSATAAGPLTYCSLESNGEQNNSREFLNWLNRIKQSDFSKVWPEPINRAVHLDSIETLDSSNSFTPGEVASLVRQGLNYGISSMTWATLDGLRLRIDTPQDTFDQLNWSRLDPQIQATSALVHRLASSVTEFNPRVARTIEWSQVYGRVVDQGHGSAIPDLPMDGYVVTMMGAQERGAVLRVLPRPPTPGTRQMEFQISDSNGYFEFESMPRNFTRLENYQRYLMAYQLGQDGSIRRASDSRNVAAKGGKHLFLINSSRPVEGRITVFSCDELTLFDIFDPRYLSFLTNHLLLDARKGGDPSRSNQVFDRGVFTAQFPVGMRYELLFQSGLAANRMMLLNHQKNKTDGALRDQMIGFDPDELLPGHPYAISSSDFFQIDADRMAQFRKAGITSRTLDQLHEQSRELITKSEAAYQHDSGDEYLKDAGGALANEVRVYQSVRDTAHDVVRAAIFLLLMLIPLSFCLERLLIGAAHIYTRLAGMAGIFTVMTGILWSFHPAFRITSQPMIIIMAFAILLMSIMVISMILSKFEGCLDEIRSGRAESSGAKVSLSSTIAVAIQLGIANMRKRLLRTVLTGVTIMLITFALLCFTSSSTIIGQKELVLDATSPYSGVLIRPPSSISITPEAVSLIRGMIEKDANPVKRYWWVNNKELQWRIHMRNPKTGAQMGLPAAVALDPAEKNLTKIDQWCPHWEKYSSGKGCYLPVDFAHELGVEPGDSLLVFGVELELLGTFKPDDLDRNWKDLDGTSMLPLDFGTLSGAHLQLIRSHSVDVISENALADATRGETIPTMSSASVAILPQSVLQNSLAMVQSIAIPRTDLEAAKTIAHQLAQRLEFPIYFGSPEKSVLVSTTPLLPENSKNLVIPILIAGLIIFNTMLSSISERKKEIHIYNSLGLAPLHVGFLFLAEALTYGLMGSVFGYVVGQGLATLFSHLGWMGGITLNYSGLHAIVTMLLVQAVVVISSLVPAYLAGRLAAPSNRMTWIIPEPKDGVIEDILPFTVTSQTANGVVQFLHDYLDAHREGSLGLFSAGKIQRDVFNGYQRLTATIWLAPYDLGIQQEFCISIQQGKHEGILEIHVRLTHQSGQEDSWWKMNRNFLGGLRKQLLGWRNLKHDRIREYIDQGANAPLQPTAS